MKIKTFVTEKTEDLDTVVNEFESKHSVKATQTDMIQLQNGVIVHKAVVFYKEE